MSYSPTAYTPVALLEETDRVAFMVKVYQHLGLALASFMAFEYLYFVSGFAEWTYDTIAGSGGAWLLFLGIFMLGTWIATQAVYDLDNVGRQYGGLFGFAAVEAVIFAPFLFYVFNVQESTGDVWGAAVVTAMGFAGLSLVAWTNRDVGSYGRNHSHCCCTPIWRQSRNLVLSRDGCFNGSINPLQHPKNNAVISSTRLRRSISYTLCLAHDHVLVHTSNIH
jgi:hypothetical protein